MTQPIGDDANELMARAKQVLADLEWSYEVQGPPSVPQAAGPIWKACPACLGIKPGDGYYHPEFVFAERIIGHAAYCKVAKAIAGIDSLSND